MNYMLKRGDTIGLACPSHVATRDGYAPIISGIEACGFHVRLSRNFYSNSCGFSASWRERADDFNELFANDEVRMVFFGGGDGAFEPLPGIDFSLLARNPKPLLSYSDGTSILCPAYCATGLITFYGQSPGFFANLSDYDRSQFFAWFTGEQELSRHISDSPWQTLRPGSCEGVLIGGYLLNFAILLGGRYFSYDKNTRYILFLEDNQKFNTVNCVSSVLSAIGQSRFMDNIDGLVFGCYSDPADRDLLGLLAQFGDTHGIPVAYSGDFGHGTRHAILPIGARAALNDDGLRYIVT